MTMASPGGGRWRSPRSGPSRCPGVQPDVLTNVLLRTAIRRTQPCFPRFALRDVGKTTTCRSNRENPSWARRLTLLATNICENVGFGRGFIVRPTMRHLLRPAPGHMRCHLAALSTNPPATRSRRRRDTSREAVPVNSGSTLLVGDSESGSRLASSTLAFGFGGLLLADSNLAIVSEFGSIARGLESRVHIKSAMESILGARISRSA